MTKTNEVALLNEKIETLRGMVRAAITFRDQLAVLLEVNPTVYNDEKQITEKLLAKVKETVSVRSHVEQEVKMLCIENARLWHLIRAVVHDETVKTPTETQTPFVTFIYHDPRH